MLVEGVNLPQRGRVTDASSGREWIVGWRDEFALSLFDGPDMVFQLNTSGHLRRVFINGQKLAAAAGQLALLTRQTASPGRVIHEQQVLSQLDTDSVLQQLAISRRELDEAVASGQARIDVIGITPEIFSERLKSWLRDGRRVEIAHGPGVVG